MARNAYQPPAVALAAMLALLGFAVGAPAQEPIGPATQTLPSAAAASPLPGAPRPQPALANFAWLAGEWHGSWGPRLAVEAWTPPHDGVMLGSFQLSENGKTLVLELLLYRNRWEAQTTYSSLHAFARRLGKTRPGRFEFTERRCDHRYL